MIDISDGLSRDLRHICQQSNVGAVIQAGKIPVHDDAIEMRGDGHSPLEHALHDGEDHELLFTGPEVGQGTQRLLAARVGRELDITFVGVITAERGIFLEQDSKRIALEPKGWEHSF
jgi:thiamine-monophosphate kinase